jgi:hypothetical protein
VKKASTRNEVDRLQGEIKNEQRERTWRVLEGSRSPEHKGKIGLLL